VVEKQVNCLLDPTDSEIPNPDTWKVDKKLDTTTMDAAETARVYGMIAWAIRQVTRCHAVTTNP
jgi:hypothetical protein